MQWQFLIQVTWAIAQGSIMVGHLCFHAYSAVCLLHALQRGALQIASNKAHLIHNIYNIIVILSIM